MNADRFGSEPRFSRRKFISGTTALGAASLLCLPRPAAAEPPPEITRIRLVDVPLLCIAPQYLAEELLRAEGFSSIEYVKAESAPHAIAAGAADMSQYGAPESIPLLDEGKPIVVVAGIHAGCWELFANERVHSIRELKGKRVAIMDYGAGDHVLLSSMLAYVGIDPRKEIDWVTAPGLFGPIGLFEKGKAEAAFAFPPAPQRMRAKGIGHVIVNTTHDRPWSQYFCCVVNANRDFIARYPIATKRALRAYLKAADVCAQQPERVARFMVSKGYAENYALQLDVLKSLPYNRWRQNNPEDTIRFHALRLHEVGMVKSTPQKLIAQGTNWRFLNELKNELKA